MSVLFKELKNFANTYDIWVWIILWFFFLQVPMYINGIFDYIGDYHPTKTANYRVCESCIFTKNI